MDFSHIGRNDRCPCGSGKKYKHCHLGRESEILSDRFDIDPSDAAEKIVALPSVRHENAEALLPLVAIRDAQGEPIEIKIVDLEAYLALGIAGHADEAEKVGGVLVNPAKTEKLEPHRLTLALSPTIPKSELIHLLAHVADYVSGSRLPLGNGLELSAQLNLPLEPLEHSQEFGEALCSLSDEAGVELDAENEVIAFLARHQMLLPGAVLRAAKSKPITDGVKNLLLFLNAHQSELDARLKARRGYTGASAHKSQ